ncbi:MAG: iron ABC transporter permease [Victivallales bacterium]|nr:iron ABC transporter permease [Victivallales bacterium]
MRKADFFKNTYFIIILFILLIVTGLLSLCAGSADISVSEVFKLLFNGHESWQYSIIMKIRLPRIILGLAVGGSLGLAGALLQGIFRNPLVEPYTLGISGGASIGICLVIIFNLASVLGLFAYPAAGFIGAIVTVIIVYLMSFRNGGMRINNLLLTGVMISFICSSAVMLMMAMAKNEQLHNIVFWTMGSLSETNKNLIFLIFAVAVLGLISSYIFCMDLNAFLIGEEEAAHIGVNTERTKKWIFVIASLLTGLSVSVAGIIGFVGLVVPHIIRTFMGPDHRFLLIGSFLAGAVFLVACDTLARTVITPLELPVGVITGIIGGSIFIYAINKRKVDL